MPSSLFGYLLATVLGVNAPATAGVGQATASKSGAGCAECPPMVRVPGPATSGKQPARPLYVARHETTWREYMAAVRQANCAPPRIDDKSRADPNDPRLNDDYPVTGVTVSEYECYLSWLTRRTGVRHRLPTADEWEHFARAGTTTNFPWGDSLGQNRAVVPGRYDSRLFPPTAPDEQRSSVYSLSLRPVEGLPPNPWGLFDTIGNAAEVTTETKEGPDTCLKHQSKDWCRLVGARGARVSESEIDSLMTKRTYWFSGAINSGVGYRPVHN